MAVPTSSTSKIIILTFIFIAFISAVLIIGITLSNNARQQAQENLAQKFEAPKEAVKSQVKKVVYKYVDEEGNIRYVEILSSGQVNLYNENFVLIKEGIQGFYRVNTLFENIDPITEDCEGSDNDEGQLTVETNKCSITLNIADPDTSQIIEDIIDEIEDIVGDTFSPTPTPIPPTPTTTPGGPPPPTATPTTYQPSPTPTVTPGGPSPTPTPLPDYMTAPPFTCDDYSYLSRPVTISNIICGAD